MKLSEFTTTIVEVQIGPDQPLGLKDPSLLSNLKPTGREIEGFDLYAIQINDEVIFALVDNNQLLTAVVGVLIDDFPADDHLKTIKINCSFTPEQFRNQGYSTALYDGLPRNGYRVISDQQLSSTALSIWKKLGTKRTLKAYDWETKSITDKNPLEYPLVSFVLENTGYSHTSKILHERKLFSK
jgi:hypothetical protein